MNASHKSGPVPISGGTWHSGGTSDLKPPNDNVIQHMIAFIIMVICFVLLAMPNAKLELDADITKTPSFVAVNTKALYPNRRPEAMPSWSEFASIYDLEDNLRKRSFAEHAGISQCDVTEADLNRVIPITDALNIYIVKNNQLNC